MLGPKPDTRSVIQPETSSLRLLLGTFSPSRRQIRSTRLAFTVQPSDAIAIVAIPGGEPDDVDGQRFLICSAFRRLALGRTMLAQNLAGKALRNGELHHDMVDAATAPGRLT